MKKQIIQIIGVSMVAILVLASCSKNVENTTNKPVLDETYSDDLSTNAESKEFVYGIHYDYHVAIVGLTIRSLSEGIYVREVQLFDFSGEDNLLDDYSFGEDVFSDLGAGYDDIAGDGIYTSANTYNHSGSVPWHPTNNVRLASNKAFIGSVFSHHEGLLAFLDDANSYPSYPVANSISTGCETKLTECRAGGNCYGCQVGITTACIIFNDLITGEFDFNWSNIQ